MAGAPFGVVGLAGSRSRVSRTPSTCPADNGSAQRIYRCPRCQIAVFSEYSRPEVWFVRAGTLDDPSTAAPEVHIYTRSKLPGVVLPGSVPAVEACYDRHELWPRESVARLDAVLGG